MLFEVPGMVTRKPRPAHVTLLPDNDIGNFRMKRTWPNRLHEKDCETPKGRCSGCSSVPDFTPLSEISTSAGRHDKAKCMGSKIQHQTRCRQNENQPAGLNISGNRSEPDGQHNVPLPAELVIVASRSDGFLKLSSQRVR